MQLKSLQTKGISYSQVREIVSLLEDPSTLTGKNTWASLHGKERPINLQPGQSSIAMLGAAPAANALYPRFRSPAPHRIAHRVITALSADGASYHAVRGLCESLLSQRSLEASVPQWACDAYRDGAAMVQNSDQSDFDMRIRGARSIELRMAAEREQAARQRALAPMTEAAFRRLMVDLGTGSFDTRQQSFALRDVFPLPIATAMWTSENFDPTRQLRDDAHSRSYASALARAAGVPMSLADYTALPPEQRAELDRDRSFDATQLPREWRMDQAYLDEMAPIETQWLQEYRSAQAPSLARVGT